VESFVLLEALVIAVSDTLADTDSFKLVAAIAPFALSDDHTLLLYKLIAERWVSILDEYDFILELFFIYSHIRTDQRLQGLTGKLDACIPFNVFCLRGLL
jgi:hypothetical protein